MSSISTVPGWMLSRIASLDEHLPGIAGAYLRASSERRHVVAAYCSMHKFDQDTALEEATFLAEAGHRAILFQAFGSVPQGYRGALRRMDPRQQDPLIYARLHRLLQRPAHKHVSRTIQQLPGIDSVKLAIVEQLPGYLCRSEIVKALENVKRARALERIVPAMVSHGSDPAGLVEALAKAGEGKLDDVVHRWCLRLRFPAGPVPASDNFRPVTEGRSLRSVALR